MEISENTEIVRTRLRVTINRPANSTNPANWLATIREDVITLVDCIDWSSKMDASGAPDKVAFLVTSQAEADRIRSAFPGAEINEISPPDAGRLVVVHARFGTPSDQLKARLLRFGAISKIKDLPAKAGDRRPPLKLVTFEHSADAAKLIHEGYVTVCGNHLGCRAFRTGGRPSEEGEVRERALDERPAVFLYGLPADYRDVDVNYIKTSIDAITWKAHRCRNRRIAVHFVLPSEAARDALLGETIQIEGRQHPFLGMKPCYGCGRTDHEVEKCPTATAAKQSPPAPNNAPATKRAKATTETTTTDQTSLTKMIQDAVTAATAPLLAMMKQLQADLADRDAKLKSHEETIEQLMQLFEDQTQERMEEDGSDDDSEDDATETSMSGVTLGDQTPRNGAPRQAKDSAKDKLNSNTAKVPPPK